MRILLPKIALTLFLFAAAQNIFAQVTSPFTSCPQAVAIARAANNDYNNEPVSFYNLNPATGAATIIPGGPLKNPASPANNMDFNGVGLNSIDGFLYGMGAATSTSQKLYRAGGNYSVRQVGVITPPPTTGLFNLGIVNPAAAEFDGSGNYYFTAITGTGIVFPTPIFLPTNFYIGKISGAASLPYGTANITPSYTEVDFSAALCSPYYLTLQTGVTQNLAQNTGLRDLVFNPRDGKLYTYVTYEFPSGSGLFLGQLLNINTTTGAVTCYLPQSLSFASATNEVAGTAMTASGAIDVLFTSGDVYKTVFTAPNNYTGAITFLGNSGITGGLRGDLAACVTAGGVLPVKFTGQQAYEKNCSINFQFTVAQEQDVQRYDIEQLSDNKIVSLTQVAAENDGLNHTYNATVPVNAKTMVLRARETDKDGKYAYSDAVTVNTQCERVKSLTIINNASVSGNLDIRLNNTLSSESYTISIYNSVGALVMKKQVSVSAGNEENNLDVSRLAPGLYLVSAASANGDKLTEKFVKK